MKALFQPTADDSLLEVAAEICAKERIDFESLGDKGTRGILNYWCSTCGSIHPLTDIIILKKKKICTYCNSGIKLRGSSNKFGKVRRSIFYRLKELGIVKVIARTTELIISKED